MSTASMEVRPLPAQSQQDDDLQLVVSQMHQKYKGFRHITEQSLLDDVSRNGFDAMDMEIESSTKPEQEKGTLEYIAAKRATMMGQLDVALNDTMMLLDFTSLLEATYKRQPAEQTISAFLKTAMPVGSLAAENWVPTNDKKLQRVKDDEQQKITVGWKAESLSKAADSLLAAASRLRDTVEQETRYWAQVLDVQEQGWTMFRSPVARSQLGVQTASIEAGLVFKQQGLITLKASDTGEIKLNAQTKNLKVIQVQVRRNNKIISTSRGLANLVADGDLDKSMSVDASLKHIRDSLFEEELYHEMSMEARNLIPFGVGVRQETIRINLRPNLTSSDLDEIVIGLVSRYDEIPSDQGQQTIESARYVVAALRLLLSNFHQSRLRRRTTKPPPMTLKARPDMTPRILTPLLTIIQHQSALQQAGSGMRSLHKVLASADISSVLRQDPATPSEAVVALQLRIVDRFEIGLPSAGLSSGSEMVTDAKIGLEIITQLIPGPDSPLGTSYHVTIPADLSSHLYPQPLTTSKRFQLSDLRSSIAQIADIISRDLLHNVLAIEFSSWAKQAQPWLRSKVKVNSELRDSCIYVRLAVDEPSKSCNTPISLTLYRSINGQAGIAESIKWDTDARKQSLMETVRSWITKAEF